MPMTSSAMEMAYAITADHRARYARDGFIHLRGVFTPDEIRAIEQVITPAVERLNRVDAPLEERDTYGKAFLQVMNIWREDEAARQVTFNTRLARIAADLMGTKGVRLYHDQALYKEPSGGHTPWHADQHYWPLATSNATTAWIPLQETPLEMGPLEFSAGSQRVEDGRELSISDESEATLDDLLRDRFAHVVEPFALGDVSFHSGWTFHRAGPNRSGRMRKVMTMIYMDRDMTLRQPANDSQENDRKTWCPGVDVDAVIDSPLNPVLWER